MLDTYWAEFLDLKDPLLTIRKKAWDRFEKIGLPTSKDEAFQYVKKGFSFLKPAEKTSIEIAPKEGLVFVDGFFSEALSSTSSPIVVLPIEKAIKSYALFLQSRMTKGIEEEMDPLALINGAFQGSGAFIYVPPQCKATLPITQIFRGEDMMSSSRIHLYVGRGAKLEIVQSSIGKSGLSNAVFDFVLDQGAHLKWVDRAKGDFQSVRAVLKKDAHLKAVFLGEMTRSSFKCELKEENAEAELYGLAQITGKDEAHFHVLIEHVAPHCRSRQHFKSVLQGQSRFSFEGKIYVHPAAQKTEAYQLNNNLLLSDEAISNAKPNLEIFADDVKASHGATVGQLDEEALFYLSSRGLSKEAAKKWLIEGFLKEILDHA